ncbi:MAG: PEP-CTERM sorting domain-containing protein [Nitrospirales bacterium]
MDLDPSIGFYSADAVTSASASILGSNGTLFSASLSTNTFNNGILVRDDAPADYYSMGLRLFSTSSIGGGFVAFSSLTFSNENAPNNIATTPFTSDALTSTPVDPADFVTTFIKLNFGSSGVGSPCVPACALFANAIRTVSSPVPAPSAIPLMGTGLVGLIVFRRWQGKFRHI